MRLAIASALTATMAVTPIVARAQSTDDAARAEASFKTGKRLLEQGNPAEACAHFAESKRLAPGVGVTLYLADCYQRLGRTASAWTEFQSAEALARARNDKRADVARLRAHALEPRLERLTVRVASVSTPPEVSLDGKALPPDAWGTAMPVDPGDHVLVARSGARHREFDVHVDADKPTAAVTIDALDDSGPAGAAGAAPSPAPVAAPPSDPALDTFTDDELPPAPEQDTTRLWAGIGLLGVGVVGVGVGTAFGVMAVSDRNASNAGPCNAADQCSPKGLSLRDDAIREARVSTVAFVVGVAGLGASAVVTFVLPRKQQGVVAFSAGPVAGGAAALVQTTF
jgi:hypothetical protein